MRMDEAAGFYGIRESFEAAYAWNRVGDAQPEPNAQRIITLNLYAVVNIFLACADSVCQHQYFKLSFEELLTLLVNNSFYAADMGQKSVSDNAQFCLSHEVSNWFISSTYKLL